MSECFKGIIYFGLVGLQSDLYNSKQEDVSVSIISLPIGDRSCLYRERESTVRKGRWVRKEKRRTMNSSKQLHYETPPSLSSVASSRP